MEPFNYASSAPARRTQPGDVDRLEPPPPPGPKPMSLPEQRPPEVPAKAVKAIPEASTEPREAQQERSVQPVSPPKRKSADETGESSSATANGATSPSTLAKRPKPAAAPPKVLPQRYEFCAVEDMVVLISHMLGELIETNDALALRTGHLTRFHSRTAPGISVLDYLHRLAKHATLTPPLLLSMVYYIDRLCALYPEFTINTLTVHRFLITAATVAAKGLSDAFWNNSTYAKVGGVRVAELKLLELEFLYRVDWKIVPNPEVLVAYYRGLVERCPGYSLETEDPSGEEDDEDEEAEAVDDYDNDGTDEITDGTMDETDGAEDSSPSGSEGRRERALVRDHEVKIGESSTMSWWGKGPLSSTVGQDMHCCPILTALLAGAIARATAEPQTVPVYIQPITFPDTAPTLLAEFTYDRSADSTSAATTIGAEVSSFEAPDFPEGARLARIGVYDAKAGRWISSTTAVSVDNFGKGYSPNFVLTLDSDDGRDYVVGVACRGVRVDAGYTRDFGPQVTVAVAGPGKQPELNKPVVLSPEGKKVIPEEKSFIQKYWWVFAIGMFLLVSGGGGDQK
ncbi:cyclin-dependent protein kinase [Echria macrotheca]|uniref:Cyclin-dependent protein kinase n=1 Tax=Echria macrotheca TaxID=438768 RepID=A0AAJ0F6A9_9PEZI|nr:cyclin-dependent protein kinase [Echria macrotheca]